MTDVASSTLFDEITNLGGVMDNTWNGNAAVGVWSFNMTLDARAVSEQKTPDDPIYDYFLIGLVGQSSLSLNQGNRPSFGYGLVVDFGGTPPAGLELLLSSPNTTVTTTTYTSGFSWGLSGSIGFTNSSNGKAGGGSIGGSFSFSHSTTRSVASLQVLNRSGLEGSLRGHWEYIVDPKALEDQGETPLMGQLLVRRPHSADPLTVNIEISTYFSNKHLAKNLDWNGLDQCIFDFTADHLAPLEKGHARISMQYSRKLAAPPLPQPASAPTPASA